MGEGRPGDDAGRDDLAIAGTILTTVREPLVILDESLAIELVNRPFCEAFQVGRSEAEGRSIYELGEGRWDLPGLRELLEVILTTRPAVEDYRIESCGDHRTRRGLSLNATRLDPGGSKILLAFRDVSPVGHAARQQPDPGSDHPEEAKALLAETLDALPSHIAVLDESGVILQVNASWRRFAEENGLRDEAYSVGRNYLDACVPTDDSCLENSTIGDGIRAVLEGRSPSFSCEYPCHSPTERRWFVMRVNRFGGPGPTRVVVSHDLITERVVAEASLRESERHLQLAVEIARMGTFEIDLRTDAVTVNEPGRAIYGWDDRHGTFTRVQQHFHPEDRDAVIRQVAEALDPDGPGSFEVEQRILRTDGAVRWIRVRGKAIFEGEGEGVGEVEGDGDGDPGGRRAVRCVGTFLDITDRKDAEQQRERLLASLAHEKSRLSTIVEQAPAFICTLRGPAHIFELVNDRYYELIGRGGIIGLPVAEALPEVVDQGFISLLDQVYRTGETFSGDEIPVLIQRSENAELEQRFVNFVYQPMRGPDGAVEGIFVHGVDVTEMVRARQAVAFSEASFRQLADAMPQIVFAARPDGHVDYFNRKWFEYTGFLDDGRTGDESWEAVHEPGNLDRIKAVWSEAWSTGQPYEIEYRLRRADGVFRWHLGRALPIKDEDGRVVRWYGTNTDIDDQKRAEAAAAEARDEAEAANRMKDQFLATLSHELRTPLNAVLGWARILRSGPIDDEDLQEGLAAIERNATAQAQIIEDLLDVSRIVSGNFKLEVQRVDVREIIESALAAVLPAANAKEIRVQKLLDSLAGPVSGDPARLQQVVWNLLSNAVKFTPKGGKVQVLLERVNSHLEISVIDTGMGIRPEFLPHVFDRFRQADSTTTRRHGGLGLGLSIVKQLAELHGGAVRAKSSGEGQGSTFTVMLPITVVHPEQPSPEQPRPRPSEHPDEYCKAGALAGVRVLVLDDEPDARQLIRRVLSECDAEIALASSAAEALGLIEQFRPDVIVSDIGMPDQDGYDFMRQVRTKRNSRDLPAAALTAFARPEDRKQALLAGFQTHVAKPVDPSELVAVVASLAGRTGSIHDPPIQG
ncbi:PAS domain-containing protein [Tautonia sp. JC769]|uniref:hybrid sensor histidine kinase/response regulator n=2 Tax=Planctomycetia TaxID=203683 RepID=UPI003457BD1F